VKEPQGKIQVDGQATFHEETEESGGITPSILKVNIKWTGGENFMTGRFKPEVLNRGGPGTLWMLRRREISLALRRIKF